jgi:hypothetical protein
VISGALTEREWDKGNELLQSIVGKCDFLDNYLDITVREVLLEIVFDLKPQYREAEFSYRALPAYTRGRKAN